MAQRYIFYGFGAETINLIDSFAVPIGAKEILLQMADILDDGVARRFGPLVSQLTCATPAALWAVLAQSKIPAGIDVDTNSVLRAFSGLPPHLRRHLGPGLVDRFLGIGMAETAASVRDITDRARVGPDAGLLLMQARIDNSDGNTTAALRSLQTLAASGLPAAPRALVELLEIKLAEGLAIDANSALLADAMAKENRGTEIGRRLTLAAIRAYAVSGQVDVTFERVAFALENGSISPQQAGALAAEAHLHNVVNSTDVKFLRVLYRFPLADIAATQSQQDVRRRVAARLIDQGLSEKVLQIYGAEASNLQVSDLNILARAALALGEVADADRYLAGLNNPASLLLRARASEMRQDYAMAAELFTSLDMARRRESAAWRAGDWPAVARSGSAPRAEIAGLMLATAPGMVGDDAVIRENGDPGDGDTTIAASKTLLAQSQEIR